MPSRTTSRSAVFASWSPWGSRRRYASPHHEGMAVCRHRARRHCPRPDEAHRLDPGPLHHHNRHRRYAGHHLPPAGRRARARRRYCAWLRRIARTDAAVRDHAGAQRLRRNHLRFPRPRQEPAPAARQHHGGQRGDKSAGQPARHHRRLRPHRAVRRRACGAARPFHGLRHRGARGHGASRHRRHGCRLDVRAGPHRDGAARPPGDRRRSGAAGAQGSGPQGRRDGRARSGLTAHHLRQPRRRYGTARFFLERRRAHRRALQPRLDARSAELAERCLRPSWLGVPRGPRPLASACCSSASSSWRDRCSACCRR